MQSCKERKLRILFQSKPRIDNRVPAVALRLFRVRFAGFGLPAPDLQMEAALAGSFLLPRRQQ